MHEAPSSHSSETLHTPEEEREIIPILTYETVEQFTVEDFDRIYPEWQTQLKLTTQPLPLG